MALLQPVSSEETAKKRSSSNDSKSKNKQEKNDVLVVTKIAQQQKRSDRYSVYINEKYSFSLSEYQLVGSGLRIGKEYTKSELINLQDESAFGKAYERTLNYVMIRPRSRREIEDYLVRTFLYPKPKSYTSKDGQRKIKRQTVDRERVIAMNGRVMNRLDEKGYIDDERFALVWVQSRQLTKKPSKRKLEQELRAKYIAPEIIAAVLQNKEEDEISNLKSLIAKKRRLSRYQDDVKLKQYLLRQGFNYGDIESELTDATD